MRMHLLSAALGFILTGAVSGAEPAKLEVHEWGTFTIVSGSDGAPLRWYQPEQALVELPDFVGRNWNPLLASKTGTGTLTLGNRVVKPSGFQVRMETPVIYFYPNQPMRVSVTAQLRSGRLTEWFPSPTENRPANPLTGADLGASWEGALMAPDDAEAKSSVPKVEGAKGAHYAHAREVPEAWHFRSATSGPKTAGLPVFPTDKFIFYRGAGDALPPMQANAPAHGRMKLMRFDQGGVPLVAFALQVEGAKARWAPMPNLPARGLDAMSPAPFSEMHLQEGWEPVLKVVADLGAAMTGELAAAGLSDAEARAMVATWSDTWFQENGSRILALLPRSWVDAVLPLTITPAPQKLTRVFVARFEMFSPDQEDTLLALLQQKNGVDASAKERFQSLHLGRFANAALQRVKALQEFHADLQFAQLQQAAPLPPTTAAR